MTHNGLDQTFFGHWALFFLSTVACAFFARCGGLGQFGLVVSVDGLFYIGRATVTYFNGVAVEYLVYKGWSAGNSSSMIFKNVCPILVDTFLLNRGLYHMIFRVRFRV